MSAVWRRAALPARAASVPPPPPPGASAGAAPAARESLSEQRMSTEKRLDGAGLDRAAPPPLARAEDALIQPRERRDVSR